MRTTVFELRSGEVVPDVQEEPSWEPFEEYDGRPLERVRVQPDVAFCQIVRGRGKLGLPDGREVAYHGPELYLFQPGTLHDWHDVEEDTLLSVCLVRQSA